MGPVETNCYNSFAADARGETNQRGHEIQLTVVDNLGFDSTMTPVRLERFQCIAGVRLHAAQ